MSGSRHGVRTTTRRPRAAVGAPPSPAAVVDLLARSEAELVAATFAPEPGEAFVHAHLAALRAAAALVHARGPAPARRRTVWEMADAVAPEVRPWTAYFADNAAARAAVEAGRTHAVDQGRADDAAAAAEGFLAVVRQLVAPSAVGAEQAGALRAS